MDSSTAMSTADAVASVSSSAMAWGARILVGDIFVAIFLRCCFSLVLLLIGSSVGSVGCIDFGDLDCVLLFVEDVEWCSAGLVFECSLSSSLLIFM